MMSYKSTTVLRVLLLIAISFSMLLVWYSAVGVRGTDQYWYIADAFRLVNGEPLVTNTYFPGEILRKGEVPSPNYVHHNSPMLYLVAFFSSATSLSVYKSWISLNTFFHMVVAGSIYKIVGRYTDRNTSLAATTLYVLSPIAIWQAVNPLLEMYFAALVASVLFCFTFRVHIGAFLCLFLLLLLGVVSHPIFILPAIAFGAFALYEKGKSNKLFLLCGSVVYFAFVFLFLQKKGIWFPSSFQPGLRSIITSAVPNKSNMFWHYAETLPVINSEFMISKLVAAVKNHVMTLKYAPLYLFTNLAILLGVFLTVRRFGKWWPVLVPFGLFGCLYLAMIILQQNHPRYQQIVASVSFVFIGIGIYQIFGRAWLVRRSGVAVVALAMCFTAGVSFYIANVARVEAITQKNEVETLREILKEYPEDSRFVGINVKPHNPFSYIISPRDMLFVRTDMLDQKGIEKAVGIFKPDYFLIKNGDYAVDGKLLEVWKSNRFGNISVFQANSN